MNWKQLSFGVACLVFASWLAARDKKPPAPKVGKIVVGDAASGKFSQQLTPAEDDIWLLVCPGTDGKERPCVVRKVDEPSEVGSEFGHQLYVHLQPWEKKGK